MMSKMFQEYFYNIKNRIRSFEKSTEINFCLGKMEKDKLQELMKQNKWDAGSLLATLETVF